MVPARRALSRQSINANKKQLGELLVESGVITRAQLEDAQNVQKTSNERIGEILVNLGYATKQQILEALEFQLNIPYVDLDRVTIAQKMAKYVPVSVARRHKLVPVWIEDEILKIAIEDPFNVLALDDVRMVSKMDVSPLLAKEESIMKAIDDLYGNVFAERALEDFKKEANNLFDAASIANISDEVDSAPIVRLVNSILEQAIKDGASDIHVEPMESNVRVRMRIDGMLTTAITTPITAHAAMITRIKIMGDLNIAEKRLPQDGRCQMEILGRIVDVRISTMPTVHGEKAVLRLLDQSGFLKPKAELGFSEENLLKFDQLLRNPHGIILVTGPTGSGKSTTLYTMLHELNNEVDNIITIEDPVEYTMPGLNQVQVNPKAGMTFTTGLRAILRQDPDTIMIGEIRDQETVEIAIRAAITGHRVLSTIHTNDAVGAISRLLDMGIPNYMLAASLVGVISQRLVRKVCPVCRQTYKPDPADLALARISPEGYTFYRGTGCANCSGTGYRGRMAIHEVLPITRQHREMIIRNASMDEIKDYSIKQGMSTLHEECVKLLKKGIISLEEVINVAYSQD